MTEEPKRTVAVEHDLPRVREWIDQSVRHAVNEAAQAFNAIRYWCDQADAHVAEHEENEGPGRKCDWCDGYTAAVRDVRALLPDFPASPERRADDGGEDGDGHESDPGRPGVVTTPDP